jgi:aldehyde dehydrogenase (NAD+)
MAEGRPPRAPEAHPGGHAARREDLAQAMSLEMGAPITMAREMQAEAGVGHADGFIEALEAQEERWTLPNGDTLLREPIGPAGLITPWNWPINQIALKVLPALATGMSGDPEAVRAHAAFGPDLRGNPA